MEDEGKEILLSHTIKHWKQFSDYATDPRCFRTTKARKISWCFKMQTTQHSLFLRTLVLVYSIRKTNSNCHSEIHLQVHEKVTHENNLGPAKVALDSSTQPSTYLLLLEFFFFFTQIFMKLFSWNRRWKRTKRQKHKTLGSWLLSNQFFYNSVALLRTRPLYIHLQYICVIYIYNILYYIYIL